MEMELGGLIEKIKREGVEEAEKKAQSILHHAEKKAHEIISKAEHDGKKIIANAEEEAKKIKKHAEESIKQSIRDAVLMLKQRVTDLFDSILKQHIQKDISGTVLRDAIVKMIEHFKKDGSLNVEILLNEKDKAVLEEVVLSILSAEIKKGVTFRISPSIEAGFRIGEKDKNYYYDFSGEALTESLKIYLNPKFARLMETGHKHA